MNKIGLYDPQYEHDACGVGLVARLDGRSARDVVEMGLTLLGNLAHRGAVGADVDSGDGAGLLMRIPDAFLRREANFELPPEGDYGLAAAFLPAGEGADQARRLIGRTAAAAGWRLDGWRRVPVDPQALGRAARQSRPAIWQFVVSPASERNMGEGEALERGLYVLRKILEREAARAGFSADEFHIASLSSRTVVYKGLLMAAQLPRFYADLGDPLVRSPFAIVHQRYSTNTFPSWRLAQPFRALAHNGEINTVQGNRHWLTAREPFLASPLFGPDIKNLFPLIEPGASDSASLDNALEVLRHGGRSLEHAVTMLMPQAWGDKYPLGPDQRGFFEFHAGLMEPWDGPAAVVFTDGLTVGACLDRNGLRPARYRLLDDGLLVVASEAGALELPEERTVEKGALRPGQMILAELGTPEGPCAAAASSWSPGGARDEGSLASVRKGRLMHDAEIKSALARRRPYRRWVRENQVVIPGFACVPGGRCAAEPLSPSELLLQQQLFGYDRDDTELILGPMAATGAEPTGSMGLDIPLAVLDGRPQSLFAFFQQRFAQITNPPLDPLREELVMSLTTFLGQRPNILAEEPEQARLIKLKHPVLSDDDLRRLEELPDREFRCAVLSASFEKPGPDDSPGRALARGLSLLEREACAAVRDGARLLVLSDRDVDERLPLPAALALAAVSRRLAAGGDLAGVAIVCETGEVREVGHLALLLSLGASAVNPWLAFETVADLARREALPVRMAPEAALERYLRALNRGLLKIMSKMGISTLRGYRGAQIFEAVGLGPELMAEYFPDIPSRIGGLGLERLERDAVRRWAAARDSRLGETAEPALSAGGTYHLRRGGRPHLWTPESTGLLRRAVREGDYELYRQYAALVDECRGPAFTLRGLLELTPVPRPLPLEDVEPLEDIRRRFVTGAMSFGSLSREAHEVLAEAMNSIGARSNCGEGGEDPDRMSPGPNGLSRRSAVRQVASGRFGVTLEYLVGADELQIKIAQGAKPGEGGHLPGPKVDREIARVRHSAPGVTLISPPPHHDIYSIEDIAQLIHDLRQANGRARISVKLAAEAGVGTVAAGVAKAGADAILISGFDGGTGAAPLSSVRQAGTPWELGLAETRQTLALNGLRDRVRLQVDGQLKTGRDVIVAACLGADEFGFATAPLVALGCLMDRRCHTNACPAGLATQDPKWRARFAGRPEHLVNYFTFVAREAREIMAALGFRSLAGMVGRVDRLRPKPEIARVPGLDLSALLCRLPEEDRRPAVGPRGISAPAFKPEATLDDRLPVRVEEALATGRPLTLSYPVRNTDRAVGTAISSRIARARGAAGLPEGTISLTLTGSAGQSFGAFAARGLALTLVGEANDYVGKGLSGGRIVVRPPRGGHPGLKPGDSVVAGNVALYGATSGELYLGGRAGERFAVRNSGAVAVVEGVGDHGCEYMTGGRVVVLGPTGVNFAAGMSGGLAYVYDRDGLFDTRCNLDLVDLDPLSADEERELWFLIERQVLYTGSPVAGNILARWGAEKNRFVKVLPIDYRRIPKPEKLAEKRPAPRREDEAA